jgi:hypothetical protein
MKLTIKQLKAIIKEQVEEAGMGTALRDRAIRKDVKKLIDRWSISEIRDELDRLEDIANGANPEL